MDRHKAPAHPEKYRYTFFSHVDCEYFPCHATKHSEDFNCLFCYCPLYALGRRCGGDYTYNAKGVKVCTHCLIPHGRGSHAYMIGRFPDIAALAKEK